MKRICVVCCALSVAVLYGTDQELTSNRGFYVGLGVANSQDRIDWSADAYANVGDGYATEAVSYNKRHFNGQAFFGYHSMDKWYWAIEGNINLSKNKWHKAFQYDDDLAVNGGAGALSRNAILDINNGNEFSAVAKLGGIYENIALYALCGIYTRELNFNFRYLANDINDHYEQPWLSSGSAHSKRYANLLLGAGVSFRTSEKTSWRFEYSYKCRGKMNWSTVVDTTQVDAAGHPRIFKQSVKQHCFTIGFTQML